MQRRAAQHELAAVGVGHARGDVRLAADDELGGERARGTAAARSRPSAANDVEIDPGRRALRHRLPAREVRWPPLGHRGDALAEVVGVAQALLLAVLRARSRRAPVRRGRRAWSRGWRAARAAPTPRSRPRTPSAAARSSSAGDEPVGEADAQRFVAPHVGGGVHELERVLLTDDGGQRHRDAEALVEAEAGEVAAEAGLGGGDAEVGRERETEPAAHRRALHRGDDRLAVGEDPGGLVVEARRCCRAGRCRLRSAPAQKFLPSEQSTTARHSASSSRPSTESASRVITSMSNQLCGGRWISTVATWSARSTVTAWSLLIDRGRYCVRRRGARLVGRCRAPDKTLTFARVSLYDMSRTPSARSSAEPRKGPTMDSKIKKLVATVALAGAVTVGTAGAAVAADGSAARSADPSAQTGRRHPGLRRAGPARRGQDRRRHARA